jgi:hypothetical protein
METDLDKDKLDLTNIKNRLRANYNRLALSKFKETKKHEESALAAAFSE